MVTPFSLYSSFFHIGECNHVNLPNPIFAEISNEMHGIFGFDWSPKELSNNWSRTLGWSLEELLKKNFLSLFHSDDLKATDISTLTIADGSILRETTIRLLCKNDLYKSIKLTFRVDKLSQSIYVVGYDFSKKEIHTHLARKANRVAKIGNWSVDLSNNYVYWSPEMWELFDLDPNIFDTNKGNWHLTLEASLIFFSDDKELVRQKYQALVEKGEEYDIEVTIKTAKGRIFPARNMGSIQIENGVPVYTFGIVQDISQSKELERSLRYQRDLLNGILDASPSVIYVKDLQGKYLLANKQAEKLVGLNKAELSEKTLAEVLDPVTAAKHKKIDELILKTKKGASCNDTVQAADGSTRFLLAEKFPLLDENGNVFAIAGISTDISEIRHYQNELLKAKEAAEAGTKIKSDFLANMSHEIRTPMNSILGMAEILMETPLDEEQKNYLNILIRASEGLLKILNDILDLSKIESGQIALEAVNYSVRDVVTETLELMLIEAQRKNLTLKSTIDPKVPQVAIGDAARLKQILINLIGNGIKFTDSGYVSVQVALWPGNLNYLQFIVEDTGIGLSDAQKKVIFERFAQADSSITRKFGGTGLGLTITKQLVELMGGTICVESEPNKGAKFTVTLPYL